MGAQGYDIKQNILFQDNQNAINMEKTGRSRVLGNPGTLIYVTPFLRTGSEKKCPFAYCSTEHMLADFFTKALQGALLAKLRDVIMGWKHADTLQMGPPSTKECVGNVVKVRSNQEKLSPTWRQEEK